MFQNRLKANTLSAPPPSAWRTLPPPSPSRFEHVQHLAQRLIDLGHERWGQAQERAVPQTTVVNSAELIEEQIGILTELTRCEHPKAERFGLLHEAGRQRHNQGGWVVGIEQALALDDEHGPRFARFSAPRWVQIG